MSIALRRIGYTGTIALGPEAGVRTGVAVSGPYEAQLEQVVVADAPATAQARARGAVERADTRKAAAPPAAAAAPTAGTAAQAATEPGPPVRQLRITARPIACPSR